MFGKKEDSGLFKEEYLSTLSEKDKNKHELLEGVLTEIAKEKNYVVVPVKVDGYRPSREPRCDYDRQKNKFIITKPLLDYEIKIRKKPNSNFLLRARFHYGFLCTYIKEEFSHLWVEFDKKEFRKSDLEEKIGKVFPKIEIEYKEK